MKNKSSVIFMLRQKFDFDLKILNPGYMFPKILALTISDISIYTSTSQPRFL
jgi:hypothetical protein